MRSFQTRRAEEILQNVVRFPRLAEAVRMQGLEALAFQRTPTAREFLELVSTDHEGRYGAALAAAAKAMLQYWTDGAPGAPTSPPPAR